MRKKKGKKKRKEELRPFELENLHKDKVIVGCDHINVSIYLSIYIKYSFFLVWMDLHVWNINLFWQSCSSVQLKPTSFSRFCVPFLWLTRIKAQITIYNAQAKRAQAVSPFSTQFLTKHFFLNSQMGPLLIYSGINLFNW